MKTKFGAIIVDGRGKVGGHVASKNRGGSYIRTKTTPTNARTSYQQAIRATFGSLAQAWRGLLEAERQAWNAAVADYAKTDIFGDLRNPSGINLYQKLNNNLISVGLTAISSPPLPQAVPAVVISQVNAYDTDQTVSVVFAPTVPADTKVKVFATAPFSPGKSFTKNAFRQIGVLASAATSPADISTMYLAKFGQVGITGQKTAVKFVPVNTETGQAGGSSELTTIIVLSD